MTVETMEKKLEDFIVQYKADRVTDLQEAKKERFENLGWISVGFALTMALLQTIPSAVFALIFFVLGYVCWSRARKGSKAVQS